MSQQIKNAIIQYFKRAKILKNNELYYQNVLFL